MSKKLEFSALADANALKKQTNEMSATLSALNTTLSQTAGWGATAANAMQSLQAAFGAASVPLSATLTPAVTGLGQTMGGTADKADALLSTLTGQSKAAENAADAVGQVGSATAKTAAQTKKAARTLAGFDEIERLAADAQTAADAATSGKTGGGSSGSAGKKSTAKNGGLTDALAGGLQLGVKQASALLDTLRDQMEKLWSGFSKQYAPAVAAWGAAWQQLGTAATAVWGPVQAAASALWSGTLAPLGEYLTTTFLPGVVNSFSTAFAPVTGGLLSAAVTALGNTFTWLCGLVGELTSTVIEPALALILTAWQGLMAGITAAWTEYGQPICDGIVLAVQGLCGIFSALWTDVLQPVLINLIALLQTLWDEHLQPLWNDLTLCIGALTNLLLQLWNSVLVPLVTWLAGTLGPIFAQVFNTLAAVAAQAVGLVIDVVDNVLIALRGLADFIVNVLKGGWDAAWNGMGATVSAVCDRVTVAVGAAVAGVQRIVAGMVSGIAASINNLLSLIGCAGKLASSGAKISYYGYASSPFSTMSLAATPVPALASGAVIPPNRQFLAMLGDQTGGTNIEAPLDTIKQAVSEVLTGMGGSSDGTPINIYLGEELLDTVIAQSQSRRALRSGGR